MSLKKKNKHIEKNKKMKKKYEEKTFVYLRLCLFAYS